MDDKKLNRFIIWSTIFLMVFLLIMYLIKKYYTFDDAYNDAEILRKINYWRIYIKWIIQSMDIVIIVESL